MEQAGSDGLGRRVASGKGPARNLFRARFAPKSGADESAAHAKPRTPKHTAHQANNFDVNFGKKMAVIPPPPAHLGVSDLVNTKALHRPHQHPTIAGAKAAGRSPDKAGSARASTQDLFSQVHRLGCTSTALCLLLAHAARLPGAAAFVHGGAPRRLSAAARQRRADSAYELCAGRAGARSKAFNSARAWAWVGVGCGLWVVAVRCNLLRLVSRAWQPGGRGGGCV